LKNLPAFCRVAGEIKPTKDFNIKFEVWMPLSGWNSKFIGLGNGNWAGVISYPHGRDATASLCPGVHRYRPRR
jgi:hypothetical protein